MLHDDQVKHLVDVCVWHGIDLLVVVGYETEQADAAWEEAAETGCGEDDLREFRARAGRLDALLGELRRARLGGTGGAG